MLPTIPSNDLPLKRCTVCKQFLAATPDNFSRCARKHDGLKPQCKTCTRAQSKEYQSRPEVKQRTKVRVQAWHKERRAMPEVQAKARAYGSEYRKRPDIWARERAREKMYRADPAIQEKEIAYRKEYYARPETKDIYRAHASKRRSVKKSIAGTYTPEQIQELLKRQKHKCYYCMNKLPRVNGKYVYHIEHTFPLSRVVGTDIPANDIAYLVIACAKCNQTKQDKFPWEFGQGNRLM